MLQANVKALCFIEPELLSIDFFAGIGIFDLFAPVTLTLTRWPSYMNLTRIPWRYTGCTNMNFLRQGFRKLSSDRQTDKHDQNYKPRCIAGGQILQLLTKELTVVFSRQDKRCWCCSWNMSSCTVESGDPGTHCIPASIAAWRCWFFRLRSRYALDVICWVIRICASRDFYQTHKCTPKILSNSFYNSDLKRWPSCHGLTRRTYYRLTLILKAVTRHLFRGCILISRYFSSFLFPSLPSPFPLFSCLEVAP